MSNKGDIRDNGPSGELHDIGKLINWAAAGLHVGGDAGNGEREPHDFEKCTEPEAWGVDRAAAPWKAIWRKDKEFRELRLAEWPDSLTWAWVSLADELAAGWGRALSEAESRQLRSDRRDGVFCLWAERQEGDPRLASLDDLREMIAFLNTSPTWEEARKKYGDLWRRRAENARPGFNVTSLLSHSQATGQLARILAALPSHPLRADMTWEQVEHAVQGIRLTVAHYRVEIYQRPFRVSEWNIFAQRREALDDAVGQFADNILSRVGNECIGVFHDEAESNQFARVLAARGFGLARRQSTQIRTVQDLLSVGLLGALGKTEWANVYLDPLPERIDVPLCEACQMTRAHYLWPRDRVKRISGLSDWTREVLEEIDWRDLELDDFSPEDRPAIERWLAERAVEDLCDRCFELRLNAHKLDKLAHWNEGSVAWLYLHVDIEQAAATLTLLHRDYLRRLHPDIGQSLLDKVEARYPLLADFLDAFERFLDEFHARLAVLFRPDDVETVDRRLLCLRLERRSQALALLGLFLDLMRERFPALAERPGDLPCPIRAAMSISSIKHPFYSHWRFLEGARTDAHGRAPTDTDTGRFLDRTRADVAVQLVGSGAAAVSIPDLGDVLAALDHGKRGALHRLREIARTSQSLAEVVLRDKEDRDREAFDKLRTLLPDRIDFESLLTLTNLAED